ncbi:hypothetical protein IHV09_11915 [Fictibacillus sp. 23RED33]|uniref:hypothetical protein n=1 Tax=unclassified Fictibacillus TaxID=2644029 RepID=UPI0018CC9353|nr:MULTISPECIES: hypothetical protein [unclassified Fictibacillus]MBH0160435.1 hypothetical protein [Fictibacillus sp. 26RED30]MBH0174270.1 hypothetical protein [Fictibacillus sp. 23RED33]
MGWIGNNSGHHSCGCNKPVERQHRECGCHHRVERHHHECGCHKKVKLRQTEGQSRGEMCSRCNWAKYRNDSAWRKLCRNRVESVRMVSEAPNCALRNRLDNGTAQ